MVTPYDLRCQRVEKPLGIAGEPTFSWKLRSEQRGERQSAYRLQAASAPELLDTPDYMDSGWRTCQRGHDPLGNPEEGGADTYFYTFSGDGVEEWAPRYCYSGIGWLEILDYPGEISPVQGTHVTLDGAMQTTTRFTLGSGTYEFVQTREAN